ncbi:MAG TPA: MFS transporter [Solirubrobacteraceae bacterium]|jgi:EmrB/QacA subfamily drug resistance transporter|nr:MFS transporter [Solirubrobacteraceae bacterium]
MNESAPDPRRWRALILLCAAQFMVILDASIVNVALPSIKGGLHLSQSNLQWVVNAYTLTFGGMLLLGGRAADLLGRRRVLIAGLGLFALASLAGGLAQSQTEIILARVVQGLGAATLSPAALAIVSTTFTEGQERNKALGVWGALSGAGGAAGVLLGGILTTELSWRWVFFVNVPVGALVIALIPRLIRESRPPARPPGYDVGGALSITIGLLVLVYALVETAHHPWGSAWTVCLLVEAAALLTVFLLQEWRSRAPLMPLRIFAIRSVLCANVVGLLIGAALYSMFYFISLYLQQVLGYSALKAGLSYVPLSVGIILAAGGASAISNRFSPRWALLGGAALLGGGLVLFSRVPPHGSFTGNVLLPSLLVACGLGLSFVALTILAVAGVRGEEAGVASGLFNTSQQVGAAIGLALLSTIANSRTSSLVRAAHGAPAAMPHALTSGFDTAFAVAAGFAVLGGLLAVVLLCRTNTSPAGVAAQAAGAAS